MDKNDTTTTNNNPFGIPDLRPLYEKVRDYVKEKQGKKGYILTDDPDHPAIYTLVYMDKEFEGRESQVKALRVNEKDELQLVYNSPRIRYTEEDIERDNEENVDQWADLWDDENVYFIPTIFNIAEIIREYTEPKA